MAKQIRKLACKSKKAVNFTHIISQCIFITTDYLRLTCVNLRRVAKRIRKSARKSQKAVKFHAYHWLIRFYNNRLLTINLCQLALGGQTVKDLCLLASKFELDQSQHKSMQVVTS